MNVGQIISKSQNRLGDKTGKFWNADFMLDGVQDGIEFVINDRIKWPWLKTEEWADLKAGTSVVTLPPKYSKGLELFINYDGLAGDSVDNFTPVTIIDESDVPNYALASSKENPVAYIYENYIHFLTPFDHDVIFDDDADEGDELIGLKMRFTHWFSCTDKDGNLKQEVTEDTDIPIIPPRFHRMLIYYLKSLSQEKQGGIDINSPPWAKFQSMLVQLRAAAHAGFRNSRSGFRQVRAAARRRVSPGFMRRG